MTSDALPLCDHDMDCSGFGWMHDAQITVEQRRQLGLPLTGEISMAHAKRIMKAYRKGWGDGYALGVEVASALPQVSVEDTEDADAVE